MDPSSNSILIFTILSLLILAAPLLSPKIKIPDIVLLSWPPLGFESRQHLRTLAAVAEAFRDRKAVADLPYAESTEDILHILASLLS